jgi:hypothetical protein
MDKKCLIAVMGPTGSGKSSFIKVITGRQDIKVGHTLLSGTVSSPHTLSRVISLRSIETDCIQSCDVIISLTAITLIDTPGFDDSSVSDLEILWTLSKWLKEHCEEGQLLTGIIYLHPITKTRVEGSTLRALTIMKKLCGDDNLKNIILVTTFWNEVTDEVAVKREKELISTDNLWKQMIDQGSRVERMSRDYTKFKPVLVEIKKRPALKISI